ncbi:MAG: SurA N-terminal domain-containing protein, partial [Desulfosarcina sp.]|nr:SurA N-terminal domain-containing protein [Desulfobacterales bacterium]
MRKNAGSLIIKLLLGAVVVVFVFWGVGTNQQSSNPEVASIEGQPIGYDEFARAYQQLQDNVRRQFGSNLNEETLKALNLKEQALNQLIDRVILVREAQAMGFRVSDEELTRHIRSISAFQSNGQFSRSQYEQVLVQFRMTPEAFEAAQRDDLMIQQVSDIVSRTAKVTQGEVTDWYRWQNATVNLEYVLFKPDPKAVINLNDDEVRSYFEENRNGYQTTSERSLRYLVFHSADYRPQVRLAADDVSAYYEEHIDEFEMPETIEARHILFKVGQDADQAAVDATRARAQEVYNQVLNGADFAELAKTHSEGPTRDAGGYLGAFGRGQMVKAFEEEAFAMDAGQVSEPVRTEFGWHIIKVEKKNPARSRSLAEADNKIRGQLTGGFARELALEDAEAAYDLSYGDEDLAAVAKQLGRELHTTGMVARNDAIEGVSDAAAFSRTAFDLNAGGISEVQEIGGDFYIIQVEEIKAPQVPALDSVRDRVKEDLKQEKRWEQAETRADAFLKTLREGGRMEELSTAQALPLKT